MMAGYFQILETNIFIYWNPAPGNYEGYMFTDGNGYIYINSNCGRYCTWVLESDDFLGLISIYDIRSV